MDRYEGATLNLSSTVAPGVVGGAASNDVWAGGFAQSGSTLLYHWDGTTWTSQSLPLIGTSVTSITARTTDDVWVGGADASLHWDGHAWTLVPHEAGAQSVISADAVADAWSVGDGLLLHWSGAGAGFADVPVGSPFLAPITALACRGILSGYACGAPGEPCDAANDPYFRPSAPVSRGQTAKLVAGAASVTTTPTGQIFADVLPSSTFYPWIEALAAQGAISGYRCGGAGEPCDGSERPYFRPNAGVTRGQLSKIVALTAGYSDPPSGQAFEDVPPGSTFYTWVSQVASRGIISGYTCGGSGEPCVSPTNRPYFRPAAGATRGQTAKIVSGVFVPAAR
jgi:hypothetical protein